MERNTPLPSLMGRSTVASQGVDALPGGTPSPGGGRPAPDEAGFRAWATVRASALRRRAYLLCGDWHAADDLVQETLISVYASWPRVARGSSIDGYASRVLVHKFIDDTRRPWHRQILTSDVPERSDPSATAALDLVERRDEPLARALAALPAQQRAVIVLRYADDLTVDEIARLLDLPPGTVKSRLSRAVVALRAELEARASGVAPVPPSNHPERTHER